MIGQMISHYRILEKLGEGGMGVVYKALDTKLGRPVALKFLAPQLLSEAKEIERLKAEACTASAINHPNICTIHDIDEADGRWFIVMEYLEGETLAQVLSREKVVPGDALRYAIQACEALSAAHKRGIIHGDVKPSNLFLTKERRLKLLDFGLSKVWAFRIPEGDRTECLQAAGGISGTLKYMSPEQARGWETDCRSDVFSFGVVFYEMLAGQRPFEGDTAGAVLSAILTSEPLPISLLCPELPKEFRQVVHKCLPKEPELRYQHMEGLLADLMPLRNSLQSPEGVARTGQKPPTARAEGSGTLQSLKRHFWIGVSLIAALILVAAVYIAKFLGGRPQEKRPYEERTALAKRPELPAIVSHPEPQEVGAGGAAKFTVEARGTGPLGYQWKKDGSEIPGASSSSYAIDGVDVSHAGRYSCVVSNTAGEAKSREVTLTVIPRLEPPVIVSHPEHHEVAAGNPATFTVVATGPAPVTYQWKKDGVNIEGATSLGYTIVSARESDAGTYICEVGNAAGSVLSNAAILTVDVPLEIRLAGREVMTWEMGTAFTDPGYTATDGQDGDLTNKVKVTGSVDVRTPGEYSLVYSVTDSTGDEAKKTRTVKVVRAGDTTPPTIRLGGESAVTLEIGSTYEEPGYTADDNDDGEITGKVVIEGQVDHTRLGEYALVYRVKDSGGNEARVTRTVHVVDTKPPYTVDLSPAKGAENVPVGTTITLRVKDDGVGVDKQTITMTVNDQRVMPTITEAEDNDWVTYDPAEDFQENQTITVTAEAADLSGNRMAKEAYSFTTGRLPVLTSHPESVTGTVGDRVTFAVVAESAVSYQWMKDGETIEGADRENYTMPSVEKSHEGRYSCVVSNPVGSKQSQPATLTVDRKAFDFDAFWKEYAGDFREPEKFKEHYLRPEQDLKWYKAVMDTAPDNIELKNFAPQGDENGNVLFKVDFVARFTMTGFLRGRRVTEPRSEVWVIDPNKSRIIEVRNE